MYRGDTMVANILVAHGMRQGDQNEALTVFVAQLLEHESYPYDLAFIESEEKSISRIMTHYLNQGETEFKIVPLLIFSAMHYLVDIPEILAQIKEQHPNINYRLSQPLGTHALMQEIIQQRIEQVHIDKDDKGKVAVVLIAHGSRSYTQAHDELETFNHQLATDYPVFSRTLYGDISFKNDLDKLAKRFSKLIIVPMFLYDGRLVNKVKKLIAQMDIQSELLITPSLNFDPLLKDIISARLEELSF